MSGRRFAASAAVALAIVFGLAGQGSVAAQDRAVTGAEAAALARAAITDDPALEDLRQIDSIDGRPVDLRSATTSLGDARAERLEALATALGSATAQPTDPTEARELADEVLDRDKYQEKQVPRPFKGALEWLADRLRPVGRIFEPLIEVIESIPGGPYLLVAALGVGFGLLVWFLAQRRSGATVSARATWILVDPGLDPDQLDAQADAASAAGDYARSVRARYEAGLLRLAAAKRIELRADTTASEVARLVGHPTLDLLTATFEAVVYGDHPASASDAEAARSGWQDVLRTKVAA